MRHEERGFRVMEGNKQFPDTAAWMEEPSVKRVCCSWDGWNKDTSEGMRVE